VADQFLTLREGRGIVARSGPGTPTR